MKVCVLGSGLRTPLLIHGLVHSGLGIDQVALYDIRPTRSHLMSEIGAKIAEGTDTQVSATPVLEMAIESSSFVISSIRVGDMECRACDERHALECGFAGQETTGPAGCAMALRTIPVALEHARIVERIAPSAWIVNFTNPAGIITQAISTHTAAKVLGICDTPAELFHQISLALGEPPEDVQCDYFGLNHLGWVRAVSVRGKPLISRLMADQTLLRRLYPTELFPASFLRALRLIPTEYLFFYYNQELARRNQRSAGVTRGEELNALNAQVWATLEDAVRAGDSGAALHSYRRYLNRRNASYMKLEGSGQSAFQGPDPAWDPFQGATGYHRIAVDAIRALTSAQPRSMILNVPNRGAIEGLAAEDIVEVPCMVDRSGARPLAVGPVPQAVQGLMHSVKHYERLTVQAAVEKRWDTAALALSINPIVGSWEPARAFLEGLPRIDPQHFAAFERRDILQSAI